MDLREPWPGGQDLALWTVDLRTEREQGITTDMAYRDFPRARRLFLLASTRAM
ncbi:hypothetical protein [Streptomyces sp. NPDC005953]|uniref:hypothetical protein n=1 Tax=Streptomyces sp. NPDC005953 TaxID=3156719 RepID=UPI0033F71289